MDHLVRVMAVLPAVGLRRAIQMASGSGHDIRTHATADLVVLTPDLHVRLTLVAGRVAHG
jgi:N-acetylglucosamine-6-phosphate deacetylase